MFLIINNNFMILILLSCTVQSFMLMRGLPRGPTLTPLQSMFDDYDDSMKVEDKYNMDVSQQLDELAPSETEAKLGRAVLQALDRDNFDLREAEIKHGRIAMLAAVGWPSSELYHYTLAEATGSESLLVSGRAPSVLNGGLDNVFVLVGLGIFFAVGAVLEIENARIRRKPELLSNFYDMWRVEEAGNYGFDPWGLEQRFFNTEESKKRILGIELFNGRVSMLACVGYAVQEVVTGLPVVSETPDFFVPAWALH
jgi:hypothetical protein